MGLSFFEVVLIFGVHFIFDSFSEGVTGKTDKQTASSVCRVGAQLKISLVLDFS